MTNVFVLPGFANTQSCGTEPTQFAPASAAEEQHGQFADTLIALMLSGSTAMRPDEMQNGDPANTLNAAPAQNAETTAQEAGEPTLLQILITGQASAQVTQAPAPVPEAASEETLANAVRRFTDDANQVAPTQAQVTAAPASRHTAISPASDEESPIDEMQAALAPVALANVTPAPDTAPVIEPASASVAASAPTSAPVAFTATPIETNPTNQRNALLPVDDAQQQDNAPELAFAARLTAEPTNTPAPKPAVVDQSARSNALTNAPAADTPTVAAAPTRTDVVTPIRTATSAQDANARTATPREHDADTSTDAKPRTNEAAFVAPALSTTNADNATPAPRTTTNTHGAADIAAVADTQLDAHDATKTQSVRELSIRITNDAAQSADVRMVERGGSIQVAVRASDPALAESLRGDVNDLVQRLAQHDVSSEVWRPTAIAQQSASGDANHSNSGQSFYGHNPGQDAQHGSGGGRQRDQRDVPAWLEEMESGTNGSGARRSNA